MHMHIYQVIKVKSEIIRRPAFVSPEPKPDYRTSWFEFFAIWFSSSIGCSVY